MIVAPQTLQSGPLSKTTTSTDGECSVTVRLEAIESSSEATVPIVGAPPCTVTETPTLRDRGIELRHSRSGNCDGIEFSASVSIPSTWTASAQAEAAAGASGASGSSSGSVRAQIRVMDPPLLVLAWNLAQLDYSLSGGRFTGRIASYDHGTVPWWRVVTPLEFTSTRPGVRESAISRYTFACCDVIAATRAEAYALTSGGADCNFSFSTSGRFIRSLLSVQRLCHGRR